MDLVLSKLKKDPLTVFTLFFQYSKVNSRKSYLLTRPVSVLYINVGGIISVVASMKNY